MALHADLDAADPTPRQLELAQDLMQGRDATSVVAVLLARLGGGAVCEPRQVGIPTARGGRGQERDRGGFDRPNPRDRNPRDRHERRDPGSARGNPKGGANDGPRERGAFAQFKINWGGIDGANPKRVLAHICRRGDVTSRDVGVIRIFGSESTIEISAHQASAFASKVRSPDPREPHLVIEPAGAGRGREEGAGAYGRHGGHQRPERAHGNRGKRYGNNPYGGNPRGDTRGRFGAPRSSSSKRYDR